MFELLNAIGRGIAKAIDAPAEDRAKIIADEIAQHTGAIDALKPFHPDTQAKLDAAQVEIARLRAVLAKSTTQP